MTWWKENELIDQTCETTYSNVVQNTIKVGPMSRSDLGTVLTCLSSNNNISVPVSSRVTIDMVFPPVDVSITTIGQPLSAGTVYIMSCEAAGSRWLSNIPDQPTVNVRQRAAVTNSLLDQVPMHRIV